MAKALTLFTELILPDPDYPNFMDSDSDLTDSRSSLNSKDDYESVSDLALIISEN